MFSILVRNYVIGSKFDRKKESIGFPLWTGINYGGKLTNMFSILMRNYVIDLNKKRLNIGS